MSMNVAVLGATGAVGTELLNLLAERNFPVGKLKLLASARSAGRRIQALGREIVVEEVSEAAFADVDIAFLLPGRSQQAMGSCGR